MSVALESFLRDLLQGRQEHQVQVMADTAKVDPTRRSYPATMWLRSTKPLITVSVNAVAEALPVVVLAKSQRSSTDNIMTPTTSTTSSGASGARRIACLPPSALSPRSKRWSASTTKQQHQQIASTTASQTAATTTAPTSRNNTTAPHSRTRTNNMIDSALHIVKHKKSPQTSAERKRISPAEKLSPSPPDAATSKNSPPQCNTAPNSTVGTQDHNYSATSRPPAPLRRSSDSVLYSLRLGSTAVTSTATTKREARVYRSMPWASQTSRSERGTKADEEEALSNNGIHISMDLSLMEVMDHALFITSCSPGACSSSCTCSL